MTRRQLLAILAALPAIGVLAGCGGGGGGGDTRTVLPRITITWAARASRATPAPSSALSALVRLVGAAPDGSDVLFVARRHSELAAYSETYSSTTPARLGTFSLRVEFFALDNTGGDIVATATGTATLTAAGELPSLTTIGRVASLELGSNPSLVIGERRSLPFTARTTTGALLAVTEGSCFWTVTAGAAFADIAEGLPRGLAPGTARIRGEVDGIASPDVELKVVSGTAVAVTPSGIQLTLRATQRFQASVTGTGTGSRDVIWSVREGDGGGTVTAEGLYTAPASPGIYHVVATSVFDPARSGSAEVQVDAGGLVVGGTWPDSGGLGVGIQ